MNWKQWNEERKAHFKQIEESLELNFIKKDKK